MLVSGGGGAVRKVSRETSVAARSNTLYKHEGMINQCVVCAATSQLHRVYVVPHCFRVHLPQQYKIGHHDILLLCNT